ncbi:MAG: carboxypeptidase-like regulatory domain-containing protein [Bacteroidales bacterium]|nr:carboxypeptidase-like regulatory domain-containing protein [Bacteroidales bacterium]
MTAIRLFIVSKFVLLLLLFSMNGFGQNPTIKGTVVDANTGSTLAFVNIFINQNTFAGTTDIDGKFELKTGQQINSIRFSYVGFETLDLVDPVFSKEMLIKLQPKEMLLNGDSIYPVVNPAYRIIQNLIDNRDLNDPEKLNSFAYTAYDKMVMTIDTSRAITIDSIRIDSTSSRPRFKVNLSEKDLFILETIAEHSFKAPDKRHEKVLATKVTGLKDPIFTFLVSQALSFDFYNDTLLIAGKKFICPVNSRYIHNYLFNLENQIATENNDTIFTISFRPLANNNFNGLQGVLTIHSDNWAIKNVIAQPSRVEKGFSIRIQQHYEKIDSIHWFPVQLNTDIILNPAQPASGNKNYPIVGFGKRYLLDISINDVTENQKYSDHVLEVNPDSLEKSGEIWKHLRADTLGLSGKGTYQIQDSVGNVLNPDQKTKTFETLVTGKIPSKFVDFEIDKFIRINSYEGFYGGFGFHTNDRISGTFKLGGFWGYGIKDESMKFGSDLSVSIHKSTQSVLRLAYKQDVIESGSSFFLGQNEFIWKEENFRLFFISQMDFTKSIDFTYGFKAPKHFQWEIGLNRQDKKSFYGYYFQPTNDTSLRTNAYRFSEIRLVMCFAFQEKYFQTNSNLVSSETNYPIIWFTYVHGTAKYSGLEQSYNKYELMVKKTFNTNYFGSLKVHLQAGFIGSSIPATNLFFAPASYRNIGLYAASSFTTMRMNEFLSDRYVSMFLTHDFGKLIYRKGRFQPEMALALNIGYGALRNKEFHNGLNFNTLNNGFYESGLLINNLLRLPALKLGVGTFYRFGSYTYPQAAKNFGYKFTMQLSL